VSMALALSRVAVEQIPRAYYSGRPGPRGEVSVQLHETLSDRMSCVIDAQGAEVYQRALKSLS
jgi:hypothetical protein